MMSVILRELTYDDLPIINSWRNDESVVQNLCSTFRYINLETDKLWFENYMKSRQTTVRLSIIDEQERLIGVIYLLNIDHLNRTADFGIFIGEKLDRGKGYGREATKKILKHAFNNLNLNRIALRVIPNNMRAIKLYESVGFKQEGILRQALFKNGKYIDLIIMSLLKEDWCDT